MFSPRFMAPPFRYIFCAISCPCRQTYVLACRFCANAFHKHLPLLLLLCTHGFLRMHSHSHTCVHPLDSFLFNLHGLTHSCFYTNLLLHQQAFTHTHTKHFLPRPTFTPTSFPQPLLWACRPRARGPEECRRLLTEESTGW